MKGGTRHLLDQLGRSTLVRLILVPATMEIMGRWNWWLPKPIARVLPHAGFEGRGRDRVPAQA